MTTRKSKTHLQAVGFAGNGDSSTANTEKLLDELPAEMAVVYVPDRILRSQLGLKNVVTWLEKELGEEGTGYQSVPKSEIVASLAAAAEKGSDPVLVFLPADPLDEADEKIILAAYDADIRVLNLSEGLDDLVLDEPAAKPQEPAEEPATRRRGKSRGNARSAPEKPDEAQAEQETEVAAQVEELEVTATGDALYDLIVAQLIRDGYVRRQRPGKPVVYPCWVDPDGNYRPRLGKGRGRKGEVTADLSEEEAKEIDGLLEDFEIQA